MQSSLDLVVTLKVTELEAIIHRAIESRLGAPPDEILTTEDAAKLLKLDPKTVSRRAKGGTIPAYPLGSEWRYKRSELLHWVTSKQAGSKRPPRKAAPSRTAYRN